MGPRELAMIIVALLSFWGTVAGVAYLFFTTRNRERLALINKGADASIFQKAPSKDDSLKWGLMTVGTGIGFFLGGVLTNIVHLPHQSAFFSMPLVFGGLGLVGYYFWMRRRDSNV